MHASFTSLIRGLALGAALAAAGTAAAQGTPATGQDAAAIQEIHKSNVSAIQHAGVAAEKATSPALKAAAQKAVTEAKRLDAELAAIAKERGLQLTPEATIHNEIKSSVDNLRAISGAEFDQKYSQLAVADREQYVNRLKQLRDQTPGKDARLKKWIDDAENTAEEQRNEFRTAAKEVQTQQRQGRTPAAQ